MKLLVTGGAGYIGSYIIKNFDKFDEIKEITSLDNLFFNQNFYNKSSKIKNVKGDVRDKSLMNKLYKSHDIIIPLAALVGAPLCKKYPNVRFIIGGDGPTKVLLHKMLEQYEFLRTNKQVQILYC